MAIREVKEPNIIHIDLCVPIFYAKKKSQVDKNLLGGHCKGKKNKQENTDK